jgi:hypothetical protein
MAIKIPLDPRVVRALKAQRAAFIKKLAASRALVIRSSSIPMPTHRSRFPLNVLTRSRGPWTGCGCFWHRGLTGNPTDQLVICCSIS